MELIDRYLYAVTKFLPESSRAEVSQELGANLADMLPEAPSDEDVRRVLLELGDPRKLAAQYNPTATGRCLIGPVYYDLYLEILKLVTGILAAVVGSVVLIAWILKLPGSDGLTSTTVSLVVTLLGSILEAMIQGALIVTLVFAVLERTMPDGQKMPLSKSAVWTPDDLESVPLGESGRISRPGVVGALLMTILSTAVLYLRPGLLAVYIRTEAGSLATPFFDLPRLRQYLPFILAVAAVNLGLLVAQYITHHWTRRLAVANALVNLLFILLIFVMVRDPKLLNVGFPETLSQIFGVSQAIAVSQLERVLGVSFGVALLICVWDSLEAFYLVKKGRQGRGSSVQPRKWMPW